MPSALRVVVERGDGSNECVETQSATAAQRDLNCILGLSLVVGWIVRARTKRCTASNGRLTRHACQLKRAARSGHGVQCGCCGTVVQHAKTAKWERQ
jgi:hypothetical protein